MRYEKLTLAVAFFFSIYGLVGCVHVDWKPVFRIEPYDDHVAVARATTEKHDSCICRGETAGKDIICRFVPKAGGWLDLPRREVNEDQAYITRLWWMTRLANGALKLHTDKRKHAVWQRDYPPEKPLVVAGDCNTLSRLLWEQEYGTVP